jgi:hypothetical protein
MPVIYLRHPDHGFKVASLDIEADYDEQHGWERYNLDTPSTVEEVAPETPVARRGRRKKAESSVETPVPDFLAPQLDEGE